MVSDQFNECRFGCLLSGARSPVEPLLQPRIVQPKRMSDRIDTVLPGQASTAACRSVSGSFARTGLHAAKLIQLPLQLLDRIGNGRCAFTVQYQPTPVTD